MNKKPKSRMDEVELAKGIFDEIVAETENEDWDKPQKKRAASKEPPEKDRKRTTIPTHQ